MTLALMGLYSFWRWASLCCLQFHYGFVRKLVYLLITYTGGLRSSDPKSPARVTQVLIVEREGEEWNVYAEGNANSKNVKSNYGTNKGSGELCQVLFLASVAQLVQEYYGHPLPVWDSEELLEGFSVLDLSPSHSLPSKKENGKEDIRRKHF